MSEDLSRETRKLEVRLEGFVKEEERFIKELKKCLDKFRKVNILLEQVKTHADPKEIEKLMTPRLEAIKALCNVFIKRSEVEHEQSHLLESYGTLILALEKAFQNIGPRSLKEGKKNG